MNLLFKFVQFLIRREIIAFKPKATPVFIITKYKGIVCYMVYTGQREKLAKSLRDIATELEQKDSFDPPSNCHVDFSPFAVGDIRELENYQDL